MFLGSCTDIPVITLTTMEHLPNFLLFGPDFSQDPGPYINMLLSVRKTPLLNEMEI